MRMCELQRSSQARYVWPALRSGASVSIGATDGIMRAFVFIVDQVYCDKQPTGKQCERREHEASESTARDKPRDFSRYCSDSQVGSTEVSRGRGLEWLRKLPLTSGGHSCVRTADTEAPDPLRLSMDDVTDVAPCCLRKCAYWVIISLLSIKCHHQVYTGDKSSSHKQAM